MRRRGQRATRRWAALRRCRPSRQQVGLSTSGPFNRCTGPSRFAVSAGVLYLPLGDASTLINSVRRAREARQYREPGFGRYSPEPIGREFNIGGQV